MLATTIYTLVGQSRVLPKYRTALVMSSMVTFIAGYHYYRIFNSFEESSVGDSVKVGVGAGTFNEAYRYVDWILTVPLLLVEVIAVLALAKEVSKPLITKLVPASAAMIALGYPGEISSDSGTKTLWALRIQTIPNSDLGCPYFNCSNYFGSSKFDGKHQRCSWGDIDRKFERRNIRVKSYSRRFKI